MDTQILCISNIRIATVLVLMALVTAGSDFAEGVI